MAVFFCHVLRILMSELDAPLKEHSLGICYYSERGDLLLGRFGLMMKNDECHDQRPLDKAKWTSEKQIRCADAQWALRAPRALRARVCALRGHWTSVLRSQLRKCLLDE